MLDTTKTFTAEQIKTVEEFAEKFRAIIGCGCGKVLDDIQDRVEDALDDFLTVARQQTKESYRIELRLNNWVKIVAPGKQDRVKWNTDQKVFEDVKFTGGCFRYKGKSVHGRINKLVGDCLKHEGEASVLVVERSDVGGHRDIWLDAENFKDSGQAKFTDWMLSEIKKRGLRRDG